MAEMRRIEWSLEARANLDNIITYLEIEWTEKEVRNFSERLEKQIIINTPNTRNSQEIFKKERSSGMSGY